MTFSQSNHRPGDILKLALPAWFKALVTERFAFLFSNKPNYSSARLESTDIVEKEMYSFDDRNGDSLTLRPEGTAGCVRAADQHGLLYNQHQRLWYQGPMFRHERPQKGRYRQFHQFGIEAFGMAGPDIDAEIIQLAAILWRELNLTDFVSLEINNIGSAEDRRHYGQALRKFLESKSGQLDNDARKRLLSNPMRVLSSMPTARPRCCNCSTCYEPPELTIGKTHAWCGVWIITITVCLNGLRSPSEPRVRYAVAVAMMAWLRS